jgi:predicted CDP-diglyceride synthetase/phosphatidate cytidylyltransferase
VALPLQYLLVGTRAFDLFTVFVPVYVFLAIPPSRSDGRRSCCRAKARHCFHHR